jgi:hypothetical protein
VVAVGVDDDLQVAVAVEVSVARPAQHRAHLHGGLEAGVEVGLGQPALEVAVPGIRVSEIVEPGRGALMAGDQDLVVDASHELVVQLVDLRAGVVRVGHDAEHALVVDQIDGRRLHVAEPAVAGHDQLVAVVASGAGQPLVQLGLRQVRGGNEICVRR